MLGLTRTPSIDVAARVNATPGFRMPVTRQDARSVLNRVGGDEDEAVSSLLTSDIDRVSANFTMGLTSTGAPKQARGKQRQAAYKGQGKASKTRSKPQSKPKPMAPAPSMVLRSGAVAGVYDNAEGVDPCAPESLMDMDDRDPCAVEEGEHNSDHRSATQAERTSSCISGAPFGAGFPSSCIEKACVYSREDYGIESKTRPHPPGKPDDTPIAPDLSTPFADHLFGAMKFDSQVELGVGVGVGDDSGIPGSYTAFPNTLTFRPRHSRASLTYHKTVAMDFSVQP